MLRPSIIGALVAACAWVAPAAFQDPSIPGAASPARAKQLVSALQARKLQAFAVKDPKNAGHYVAVLHVPGAQLLVVGARHGRPSDVDYYLYKKDYMNAYQDLNSSVLSQDKVLVEDSYADGLVAVPGKDLASDTVTMGGAAQVFDGVFADPKKRNDKRMPMADYAKAFGEADASYVQMLDALLAALSAGTAPAFPDRAALR
ncbi:MAG: hypothetical protein R2752_23290 [Vicinamibacterales bacterium]